MKKAILISIILLLLTSCFIAIRVPTSTYTLTIENPTDAPIQVTSSSFSRVNSVTVAAKSSKTVEVWGSIGSDIILTATGRYYSGTKGMAVEIRNSTPRCSMLPDIGWVRVVNGTGYYISDVSVAGSNILYDANAKPYSQADLRSNEYAYAPVFSSDCEKTRSIEYYRNGYYRSYMHTMPKAGSTVSITLTY